jgi:hypothetical protein
LSVELVLDNSAWASIQNPSLSQTRVDEIAGWLEDGRIATCLPFLLEAGYSARSARDHTQLIDKRVKTDLRFDSVWLAPRGSL